MHNGIVLIALGLVLFLWIRGALWFPLFETLSRFWPVFLVAGGLSLLLRRFRFAETLIFLVTLLAFLLFGLWMGSGGTPGPHQWQPEGGRPLPERAAFAYEGLFTRVGIQEELPLSGEDGLYRIRSSHRGVTGTVDPAGSRLVVEERPGGRMEGVRRRHTTAIDLHTGPSWEMDWEISFSDLSADLSGLQLEGLELDTSFSGVRIVLPVPQAPTVVRVDSSFSRVRLDLPAGTPYRVSAEAGFATVRADGQRLRGGSYASSGYREDGPGYDIRVDTSFGEVRIVSGTERDAR